MEKNSIHHSLSLHEFLAHTHLLTERQRRMGSIGPVGPLLCVHAEGKRDGQPVAVDRFFAGDCSPRAALLAMRNYGPARDNLLFVVDAPPERQRAFVRAGFRLQEVQWLMACTLAEWQPLELPRPDLAVHSATQASDALLLNTIEGLEPVPIDELRDPALLHYYCLAKNQPTAYGRSARYDETIAWVSHVFTPVQHRRQGYASALMNHLLADSAKAGVVQSLLLSTEMAHLLYTRIGYGDIAPVAILQAPPALLRRIIRGF
ncbi:MAG: GNAT family N-acetyltransferase [Caldilineaceae bacterium]|nr:GNAT family N-acetyltransferase [Caldilineaceae bacterium]